MTVIAPAFDSQNYLDLEFSTITDAIDSSLTITESLARLFQHTSKNPFDYPDITQMSNMSGTQKTLPILALVKALQQALVAKALQQTPILPHHFSHHPAMNCAWIGGMPAV